MTLLNQDKYEQIKSCEYLGMCIYTLQLFSYLPTLIPHLFSAMKPLTRAQHNHVLELLDQAFSSCKIAQLTGISLGSITKIHSLYHPNLTKSSGGRPRKLSPSDVHYAVRLVTSRKADNAAQVTKSLENVVSTSISSRTIHRELKRAGLKPIVKKKRPFLSSTHRRKRLEFAERHQHWTVDDWKRVVWSDETKINRLGSDGRKYVWIRPGEGLTDRTVQGTVKFGGGSLMFWGCMLWDGVGYGTKIDGKMDAQLYTNILEDELQESIKYYGYKDTDIIFQQDNDPKHTSKMAKTWMEDHDLEVMIWPPQSADLNPIEHL